MVNGEKTHSRRGKRAAAAGSKRVVENRLIIKSMMCVNSTAACSSNSERSGGGCIRGPLLNEWLISLMAIENDIDICLPAGFDSKPAGNNLMLDWCHAKAI
jgi:hypothetical protein